MWPSTATSSRHINYGLPPEFYFVAPASSFNHHHPEIATTINFEHQGSNAIGVIPLLTATPCVAQPSIDVGGGAATANIDLLNNTRPRGGVGGGMQLWQHQDSSTYLKKPLGNTDHTNLVQSGSGGGGNPSSAGTTACQDCGNQAKKDCSHNRCRTCCKSRGYDCSTHVKSTWFPAARRRERQLVGGNAAAGSSQSQSTSGTKKPRLGGASQTTTTSTSNTTPPRSFDTSSGHQDASLKESLPVQVRAPAVFKCVRVTAVDDGNDEYAYQAVVRIGGHVFKGFLYDQGFEEREADISELQLGGVGGGRNGASSSHPGLDSSDIFAASGGGLLGGSGYGNQIN